MPGWKRVLWLHTGAAKLAAAAFCAWEGFGVICSLLCAGDSLTLMHALQVIGLYKYTCVVNHWLKF